MILPGTRRQPAALALVTVLAALGGGAAQAPQEKTKDAAAAAAFDRKLEEIDEILRAGRYGDAIDAAKRLLAEAEAGFGPVSLETANALAQLAQTLGHARGMSKEIHVEPGEILPLAIRCLAIRERLLGPDHVDVGHALSVLATVQHGIGDDREAPALLTRALAILEKHKGPQHLDVAWLLVNLGTVEARVANYARAREANRRAAAIFGQVVGPDSAPVAAALQGQGFAAQQLGDAAEAERLYRQALDIRERRLGRDSFRVTQTLSLLGEVLLERGAHAEARRVLERALAIREKTLGPGNHFTADAVQQLAGALWKAGDATAARSTLERALALHEAADGSNHPSVAMDLHRLAEVRAAQDASDDARGLAQRALAIREDRLGPDHPLTAETRRLLASLSADPAAALELLDRALAASRAALGPIHPQVAQMLRDRARRLLQLGDRPGALDSALAAESAAREWLRLALRSLEERGALAAGRNAAGGLDLALSAAREGVGEREREAVFDALVRSRALVLDELAARRRAVRASGDPEIAGLEAELARRRERLARLALRGLADGTVDGYRRSIEDAGQEKEEAEAALALRSRAFREQQDQGQRGSEAVRAALERGDAIVSFVRYRQQARDDPRRSALRYAALVSRAGEGAAAFVALDEADRVDGLVSRWRAALLRARVASREPPGGSEYDAAALELRRRIWDPVAAALRGATRVFVVPDGALHLVSFAALPAPGGEPLVESGLLFHYVSAERDLVADASPPTARGLLALGDPDFGAAAQGVAAGTGPEGAPRTGPAPTGAACGALARLRFAPLPASGRELQELTGHFDPGQTRRLRRRAASEAAVKQGAAGRRVLHLATHAFFLGEDCPSALTSAGPDGGAAPGAQAPLLRAGLALAGANRHASAPAGTEDGLLTAEEVAGLDLAGMEWAVLSACGTGLGEITAGEGVLGLGRAFRVAGVATTILSLWEVDDESARGFMRALYRARFVEGKTTAEAVQAATLGALRERRARGRSTHPVHWAAFIASGSWR